MVGKDNAAFTDIAKKMYGVPLCWKGKVFAGHVRPSLIATNHRALAVSLLHKAAVKFIRKHQHGQAGAAREEEEERLRTESLDSLEKSILAQQESLARQMSLLEKEKEWRSRPRDRESDRRRSSGHSSSSTSRRQETQDDHSKPKRRRY